jgi:hypothetical protein
LIGPSQGIYSLQLEDMGIFIRDEPLDLELPAVPFIDQKNLKKKPSGISSVRNLTLSSPSLP